MNILIVDDEILAREGLGMMLAGREDICITGECSNGFEAVSAIERLRPDLVFLDINMPGMNGFDVVEAVGAGRMPQTIFLTAYDEYALEAFRINALDYLLKPVAADRLSASLDRARQALAHEATFGGSLQGMLQQMRLIQGEDRVMLRADGHVFFLKPEEIIRIQADGDYVTVITRDRSHLIRDTMKNMEERLKPMGFQRIHRSSIVNLDVIEELVCNDSGDYDVILHDRTTLKLSRSYREALYARLAPGGLPE